MRLQHVLNTKDSGQQLFTVGPEATVEDVIQILCRNRIGALLVIDNETRDLVGIVSERDILRKCGENCSVIGQTEVAEIMTREVIASPPDQDVRDALRVMSAKRIRHLPVVDGKQVIGIVSIGDLVQALYQQDELKLHQMQDLVAGTYGLKVF